MKLDDFIEYRALRPIRIQLWHQTRDSGKQVNSEAYSIDSSNLILRDPSVRRVDYPEEEAPFEGTFE